MCVCIYVHIEYVYTHIYFVYTHIHTIDKVYKFRIDFSQDGGDLFFFLVNSPCTYKCKYIYCCNTSLVKLQHSTV